MTETVCEEPIVISAEPKPTSEAKFPKRKKKKVWYLYPKHRYFDELGMYDWEKQLKDAREQCQK